MSIIRGPLFSRPGGGDLSGGWLGVLVSHDFGTCRIVWRGRLPLVRWLEKSRWRLRVRGIRGLHFHASGER